MNTPRTIAIVGGGVAAAETAKTLHAEGYSGHLVVLTDEACPPYERPPLTKAYLRGEAGEEKLVKAINTVAKGSVWVPEKAVTTIVQQLRTRRAALRQDRVAQGHLRHRLHRAHRRIAGSDPSRLPGLRGCRFLRRCSFSRFRRCSG